MAFKLTGNGWPKPRLHPKDLRAHDGVKRGSPLPKVVGDARASKHVQEQGGGHVHRTEGNLVYIHTLG
jgi:hypothetical protein